MAEPEVSVARLPSVLLRLEGAVVAVGATVLYFDAGNPWWLFLLLALAPDLSMVGYAAGLRIGALVYDVAHTYALPVAMSVVGVMTNAEDVLAVGLIWFTHIGVDRAVGYGLKYPTGFKDTHLQRV